MISIAIINLKGGVGKSVTACNLAAELAAKSKSVLVVDLDKQGNTSKFFGVADYDRPCVSSVLLGVAMVRDAIVETAIPAVALLPCDMRMLKANREMIQDTGPRQFYLRNCLEPVEGKYDYCLMDCPPDLDMGSINALTAADWVIIPVDCDEWACDGMREIIDQIEQVQMYYNPHLKVMGALMTKYRRTRYAGEVVHQLNEAALRCCTPLSGTRSRSARPRARTSRCGCTSRTARQRWTTDAWQMRSMRPCPRWTRTRRAER